MGKGRVLVEKQGVEGSGRFGCQGPFFGAPEPNISCIYTPQLKSCVSLLRSKPMKMEWIESSETSALKAQTPEDYPENITRQHKHYR